MKDDAHLRTVVSRADPLRQASVEPPDMQVLLQTLFDRIDGPPTLRADDSAHFPHTSPRWTHVGVMVASAVVVVVAVIGVMVARPDPESEVVLRGQDSGLSLTPGGIWTSNSASPAEAVEEFLRDGLDLDGMIVETPDVADGPTWVSVTSSHLPETLRVLVVPVPGGWTVEQVDDQPTLILREQGVGRVAVTMRPPKDGVSAEIIVGRSQDTDVYTIEDGNSGDDLQPLLPVDRAAEVTAVVVIWRGATGAPVAVEGVRFS